MVKNQAGILKNKYFLYVTAFFSGMSVMAIELGASRLLAPYFSSSQIVWTVIIGMIMIALAIGNVIGGRLADRNPDPAGLYLRLLTAAVWTAAIPFFGKYIIAGVSLVLTLFVKTGFLVWASLLSCFLIFVFPLALLGTAAPALIKFSVENLEENGRVVGELEALNTIGSIIGTFVPTFLTIPTVGTSATFLIFAAILALISLAYFFSAKRYLGRGLVSALIITSLVFVPFPYSFAFWDKDLTYEGESIYNYLQVKEDREKVILSTNVMVGVQSVLMKNKRLTGMYYDYALAAPLLAGIPLREDWGAGAGAPVRGNEGRAQAAAEGKGRDGAAKGGAAQDGAAKGAEAQGGAGSGAAVPTAGEALAGRKKDVLVLGLGTGTFAKQCLELFQNTEVTGVEIDDRIVDLAHAYFDLPEEVKVSVDDGRAWLRNAGKYDVIMVDAYQDITIPFQMSSVEFFAMVKDHLKEGGVMVVNLNMRSDREGSINEYLCDTIGSVFGELYRVPVAGNTNAVLFARAEKAGKERNMKRELTALSGRLEEGSQLKGLMKTVAMGMEPVEPGGLILTDDKAPVELLGIKVIDDLIGGNLAEFREGFWKAVKTGDWSRLTQMF